MAGMWDFPCFGPARAHLSRSKQAPIAGGHNAGNTDAGGGAAIACRIQKQPAPCPRHAERKHQSSHHACALDLTDERSPPLENQHHDSAGNTLPYGPARLGLLARTGRASWHHQKCRTCPGAAAEIDAYASQEDGKARVRVPEEELERIGARRGGARYWA